MPFIYLHASLLDVLKQHVTDGTKRDDGNVALRQLARAIDTQTEPDRARVIREITFEGSEAVVREQLARSMPEGVSDRGPCRIIVRTISNSLPQVGERR